MNISSRRESVRRDRSVMRKATPQTAIVESEPETRPTSNSRSSAKRRIVSSAERPNSAIPTNTPRSLPKMGSRKMAIQSIFDDDDEAEQPVCFMSLSIQNQSIELEYSTEDQVPDSLPNLTIQDVQCLGVALVEPAEAQKLVVSTGVYVYGTAGIVDKQFIYSRDLTIGLLKYRNKTAHTRAKKRYNRDVVLSPEINPSQYKVYTLRLRGETVNFPVWMYATGELRTFPCNVEIPDDAMKIVRDMCDFDSMASSLTLTYCRIVLQGSFRTDFVLKLIVPKEHCYVIDYNCGTHLPCIGIRPNDEIRRAFIYTPCIYEDMKYNMIVDKRIYAYAVSSELLNLDQTRQLIESCVSSPWEKKVAEPRMCAVPYRSNVKMARIFIKRNRGIIDAVLKSGLECISCVGRVPRSKIPEIQQFYKLETGRTCEVSDFTFQLEVLNPHDQKVVNIRVENQSALLNYLNRNRHVNIPFYVHNTSVLRLNDPDVTRLNKGESQKFYYEFQVTALILSDAQRTVYRL